MRIRTLLVVVAAAVGVALTVVPAAGAVAAVAVRGSNGCGRKAATGTTTRQVSVGGADRQYLLSIPAAYEPSTPAPLVFDFHGLGSDMQEQALYSGLNVAGSARGYVVITPDGQGEVLRHWSLLPSGNPDVAFAEALLRAANRNLCIDPARVYATGISNGAMFSTVLACAMRGRLAAIAPVAGVNATQVCRAGTPPVSVLAFHGTADPIVPYAGGAYFSGAAFGRASTLPQAKPVDDAVAAWAAFDGCATPAQQSSVADDVERLAWAGCSDRSAVELYRIVGGGHTWPGATALRSERLGATTSSIDATKLVLDFFDAHPRAR